VATVTPEPAVKAVFQVAEQIELAVTLAFVITEVVVVPVAAKPAATRPVNRTAPRWPAQICGVVPPVEFVQYEPRPMIGVAVA
jgi:hypothetical protein